MVFVFSVAARSPAKDPQTKVGITGSRSRAVISEEVLADMSPAERAVLAPPYHFQAARKAQFFFFFLKCNFQSLLNFWILSSQTFERSC